jgi:Tfp pilus assembly protein PilV
MHSGERRRAGLTLVETLLATTILLIAFLTLFELIAVSVHHQAITEQQMQAALVAENRLQEIRADNDLARGSFPDPGWAGTVTEGQFQVTTTIEPCARVTVSEPTEDALLGNDTRQLAKSLVQARVSVRWGHEKVVLTTLLGEPDRVPGSVRIETIGDALKAEALDATGQPIEDAMFEWWSEPSGSQPVEVTPIPARDRVNLRPAPDSAGGSCRIMASCRYLGRELTGSYLYQVRR